MVFKQGLLCGIIFLASAAFCFNLNPRLTGLPDNTWMILDSAGIQFDGHTAYSGGTYDRTNHQFLIFGGGHWDGWKNDVLAFNVAANTWKSMYTPTPSASYNCGNVNTTTPGMLLAEQMPASRHTWDAIEFIDHLGKMIIWSQATYSGIWSCPGNTLPADTWLYSYSANKWEYKNVARNAQPAGEGGAGAYDPVGRMYYAVQQDKSDWTTKVWRYNADTDQWTRITPNGTTPSMNDHNLVTDRKRQVIYACPQYYDIKNNTWSTLANVPSGLTGGYGTLASYDEVNDAMVFVRGGSVYVYHIAQTNWETLSPTGIPSITREYGRFFYDPVDNVHLLILMVNYHARTYAYRYKGGAPSAIRAQPPKAAGPAVIMTAAQPDAIYDMIGRRVGTPRRSGIYLYRIQGRIIKRVHLR